MVDGACVVRGRLCVRGEKCLYLWTVFHVIFLHAPSFPPKFQNTTHPQKPTILSPTMAAAAASYDHLPMELRLRYYIQRMAIAPTLK